ncbi:MAG: adenine nucleotide alpha hydrolase [Thermoplasmata archaeon]|nr:adenine nucleotide alpha hydrolase [Thermoplasmata archaeon]
MTSRPRAVVAWSSGKDCAWALHVARSEGRAEIVGLLATVTGPFDRVSMHGVRSEILFAQGRALGLPVQTVSIPYPCPNEVYETRMEQALARLASEGVSEMVFGDLFLEDVRKYREEKMTGTGIRPTFPLWGRPTHALAEEMIREGVEARIVCLDPRRLPSRLAGRTFDPRFLAELPTGVDPCGERGEFHTCVTAGPMFSHPVTVRAGAVVERDGFVFADLELVPEVS